MNRVKIGYAQFCPEFGNRVANLAKVQKMVKDGGNADLLVFAELGVSGYDFRDREELISLAEPFDGGPTSLALIELAEEYSISLIIGYPEVSGEKVYNSCMLVTPDGKKYNYRKTHLFSRETLIFDAGDAPPPVISTPAGKIGLMICFDWVYPEIARLLTLAGAQIIAHPSNLVLQFCQKAMFARSVENGVFTITANRIGTEDRAGRSLTFTGASQVLDPKGNILAQAPDDEEHLAIIEVDLSRADDKFLTEHNHLLEGRRVDLYSGLVNL
ncbi:MAG: nitrilase-related carbon-nitrogen hydrolase [Candidatus Electryonea clarkiae]|nr:nitrilase-related carbon-nitrogen hydrolase [Candidatus Electryonea clarkiae]MDP8288386.1 nitrilase-related carbon-nitrogen hydrolase [Candidatus Electryonea clarkiae]